MIINKIYAVCIWCVSKTSHQFPSIDISVNRSDFKGIGLLCFGCVIYELVKISYFTFGMNIFRGTVKICFISAHIKSESAEMQLLHTIKFFNFVACNNFRIAIRNMQNVRWKKPVENVCWELQFLRTFKCNENSPISLEWWSVWQTAVYFAWSVKLRSRNLFSFSFGSNPVKNCF